MTEETLENMRLVFLNTHVSNIGICFDTLSNTRPITEATAIEHITPNFLIYKVEDLRSTDAKLLYPFNGPQWATAELNAAVADDSAPVVIKPNEVSADGDDVDQDLAEDLTEDDDPFVSVNMILEYYK